MSVEKGAAELASCTGRARSRDMPKKLGRPPRISRESVLIAAERIATDDPMGEVSIGRIARDLKVTPMAIYTYFAGKDDLLQALSQRLLEGLEIESPLELAPLERVRLWAIRIRSHFLRNPPLIRMLSWEGGHNSVAWLNKSAPLLAAIRELKLEDDSFSQSVLWTWAVVLGAVQFEMYDRQAHPRLRTDEYDKLSDTVRDDIGKVDCFLKQEGRYDFYFNFQIDRLIGSLRQLATPESNLS